LNMIKNTKHPAEKKFFPLSRKKIPLVKVLTQKLLLKKRVNISKFVKNDRYIAISRDIERHIAIYREILRYISIYRGILAIYLTISQFFFFDIWKKWPQYIVDISRYISDISKYIIKNTIYRSILRYIMRFLHFDISHYIKSRYIHGDISTSGDISATYLLFWYV